MRHFGAFGRKAQEEEEDGRLDGGRDRKWGGLGCSSVKSEFDLYTHWNFQKIFKPGNNVIGFGFWEEDHQWPFYVIMN